MESENKTQKSTRISNVINIFETGKEYIAKKKEATVNFRLNYSKLNSGFVVLFVVIVTWCFSTLLLSKKVSSNQKANVVIVIMLLLNVTINCFHSRKKGISYFIKKNIMSLLFGISAMCTFIFVDNDISLLFIALTIILLNNIKIIVSKDSYTFSNLILATIYFTMLSFSLKYITTPLLLGETTFKALRFKGYFSNTNALGLFGTALYCVNIYVLIRKVFNKKTLKFLSFVTMVLTIILIIISSSRNAFLASTLITIWLFHKEMKFSLRLILFWTTLVGIGLLFLSLIGIDIGVVNKTIEKLSAGKILDGRVEILITSIRDISLFGHGKSYYINKSIGVHNSFAHILNLFGIFGVTLYIFMMSNIYFNIKNLESRKLSQTFLIVYVLFSLNETIYFSLLYFLFVILSSVFYKEKSIDYTDSM